MWNGKSVSVVLMTYAERESIRQVILDFFRTGVVDEVIAIDNNAERGTVTEILATRARHVHEPKQGYGYASRRGLKESTGDLVVLCEPDGTFLADDIFKLLMFSDQFDVVFGSRTFRQLVWPEANMAWPLRIGNAAVAKLLQTLFRSAGLTDVGCTYRLLSRAAVDEVLPKLRIGGSQFGPELMMQSILSGMRHVEVPINYLPRVGDSSVTGDKRKTAVLGVQMLALIILLRARSFHRFFAGGTNVAPKLRPSNPIAHLTSDHHRPIDITAAGLARRNPPARVEVAVARSVD